MRDRLITAAIRLYLLPLKAVVSLLGFENQPGYRSLDDAPYMSEEEFNDVLQQLSRRHAADFRNRN